MKGRIETENVSDHKEILNIKKSRSSDGLIVKFKRPMVSTVSGFFKSITGLLHSYVLFLRSDGINDNNIFTVQETPYNIRIFLT